jgi:hypothetical protein
MHVAVHNAAEGWIHPLGDVPVDLARGPGWVQLAFPTVVDEGVPWSARLTMNGPRTCGTLVVGGRELAFEDAGDLVTTQLGQRDGQPLTWSGIQGGFAARGRRVALTETLTVLVQDDGRMANGETTRDPEPPRTAADEAALAALPWARAPKPGQTLFSQLVPLVRPVALAAQRPGTITRPFVRDAVLVLAADLPDRVAWIGSEALAAAGLTEAEAFDLAVENLADAVPWVRLSGDATMRMARCGGNFEPSLLLDPEVEALVATVFGERRIARLVTRDLLYYSAPEHTARIAWCDGVARDFRAKGEEWTTGWLTRGANGWTDAR